jgi:hypothetical protein
MSEFERLDRISVWLAVLAVVLAIVSVVSLLVSIQ